MKKIVLSLLVLVAPIYNYAQNDTIIVKEPQKVEVIESKSSKTIKIYGSKDNPDYLYTSEFNLKEGTKDYTTISSRKLDFSLLNITTPKRVAKWRVRMITDIYIGLVSPLSSPKEMGVKHFGSYELGFSLVKLIYSGQNNSNWTVFSSLELGDRYFKTRRKKMIGNQDGYLTLTDFPTEATSKRKSRLDVHTLALLVGAEYKLSNNISIRLDFIENYNFGARSVTKYRLNGSKNKFKKKSFETNDFTSEFRFSLRCNNFRLYLKYAPQPLLKTEYAPKINYMSIGIIIQ